MNSAGRGIYGNAPVSFNMKRWLVCHGLNLQKAKLGWRTDPFYGETQSSQRVRMAMEAQTKWSKYKSFIQFLRWLHMQRSGHEARPHSWVWVSSVCLVSMKRLLKHSCSLRLEKEGEGNTSSHVLSAPCVPAQCCVHKHDFTMRCGVVLIQEEAQSWGCDLVGRVSCVIFSVLTKKACLESEGGASHCLTIEGWRSVQTGDGKGWGWVEGRSDKERPRQDLDPFSLRTGRGEKWLWLLLCFSDLSAFTLLSDSRFLLLRLTTFSLQYLLSISESLVQDPVPHKTGAQWPMPVISALRR